MLVVSFRILNFLPVMCNITVIMLVLFNVSAYASKLTLKNSDAMYEGRTLQEAKGKPTNSLLDKLGDRAHKLLHLHRTNIEDTTLGKVASPSQELAPTPDGAVRQTPLAFNFAPGGLLFPYYVGVAYELRDLGLLRSSTPIGGSSAGSIVASLVANDRDESEVREGTRQLYEDVRNGEKLQTALRRQLEKILPDDAAERAQRNRLTLNYLEVYPEQTPRVVSKWKSKDDLIETILASCNYPLFFAQWPLVKCREAWAIDGLYATEESQYGCPPLNAERTVAIIALPDRGDFNPSDVIQPGRGGMELPDGVDSWQWDWWKMIPASNEKLDEMISLGKSHARRWATEQRMLPAYRAWALPRLDRNVRNWLPPPPLPILR